jgi:type 1 glutamine amidotransferase
MLNLGELIMNNMFVRIIALPVMAASSLLAADEVKTSFGEVNKDFIPKIDAAIPASAAVRPKAKRKILLFSRTEGYAHFSIPAGIYAITKLGEQTGAYAVESSGDMEIFTPARLKGFDAIFFNNTTGLKPNEAQRRAILDFVEQDGKGLIGIHAATDNFPNWPEGQALIGGKFAGHPWGGGDVSAVKLDDPAHPLNKPFGGVGFWIKDEIYQYDDNYKRTDRRVLLSLDMSKPQNARLGQVRNKDNDIGISWVKQAGRGRVFYSSFGHNNEVFWIPQILAHWLDGIQYALGDYEVEATPLGDYKPALAPENGVRLDLLNEAQWVLTTEAVEFLKTYKLGGDGDIIAVRWRDQVRLLDEAGRKRAESSIVAAGDDISLSGRVVAAEVLGKFGGAASVPLLAKWAQDKDAVSATAAVRALARIPLPAAGRESAGLLAGLPDNLKIAALDGLAERADPVAVKVAVGLLRANEPVMAAALYYLGSVGSDEAIAAVSGYKAGDKLQDVRAWALIGGGLRMVQENRAPAAAVLFKGLLGDANSGAVRLAAAQGLLNAEGAAAVKGTLSGLLQGKDERFRQELARVLIAYPEPEGKGLVKGLLDQLPYPAAVAAALTPSFGSYPEDVQLALLRNISNLQVADKFQALIDAGLASKSAEVQVAALTALGFSGNEKYFDRLSAALKDDDTAKAAIEALSRLRGQGVARAIAQNAAGSNVALKPRWLEIVALRADHENLPLVLESARAAQPEVRSAAFAALKNVTGGGDLPALVELRSAVVEDADKKFWREALLKAAKSRAGDAAAVKILQPLAENAEKSDVQTVANSLASINNKEAAAVISTVLLASPDADCRKDTIRAISGARNLTTLALLEEAATKGQDDAEKILALRGLLDTVRQIKIKDEEKVKIWARAWELAGRDEEKEAIAAALKEKKNNGDSRKLMDKLNIDYK